MVSTIERTGTIRTDIRPAGTLARPAASPRVAVFANSPALRAGLTALLSEDERIVVLTDDALAGR